MVETCLPAWFAWRLILYVSWALWPICKTCGNGYWEIYGEHLHLSAARSWAQVRDRGLPLNWSFRCAAIHVDIAAMWPYVLHLCAIYSSCWLRYPLTTPSFECNASIILWICSDEVFLYKTLPLPLSQCLLCATSSLKQPNLPPQPRGKYQLCIFIMAKKTGWKFPWSNDIPRNLVY